ncbi:minor tail protein [Tsukamurella phage TPA2]|uniref:minor tail protein n=1 Tax=Tsukamurella phage TPA2 TaxID=981330 RepID=UPI0001FF8DC6|nr:minor tail protein [Tsukamurella phage TPA2]ADX31961.1 hypothetical protein [Tsukamurella phage TPA2]
MPLYVGPTLATDVYNGVTPADSVFLGNTEVWRRTPTLVEITGNNAAYPIPAYAAFVDVVILSGGGGGREGDGGAGATGNGGKKGQWSSTTLNVAALGITTLNLSIGAGGPAGAKDAGNVVESSRGGTTTVAWAGGSLSIPGGGGGSGTGGAAGESPGSYSYGGQTFTGGGTAPSGSSRTNGNPPGGGGGGGAGGIFNGQTAGMAGAQGRIWLIFRSY